MTKKEIQYYKDKRNLEKGFNAYWNQGFEEAVALINKNEPEQLILSGVSHRRELVCDCTVGTQVSQINGKYICCNCNKPTL